MRDYRTTSFWLDDVPGELDARAPSLPGDIDADVCIVGAGYTGLWTAYYLAKADPKLRIVVLEREIAGFGASGRNGGWCSAYFAASLEKLAAASSRSEAIRMQRTMFDTVDEVGRACAEEGIDAQFHKGGVLEPGHHAGPAAAPARRAGVLRVVGLRRARLGVARRGRGAPAAQRHGLPRRPLQPALRPRSAGAPRPRPGRDGREARRDDLRADAGVVASSGGIAATPLGRVKAEVVVRATEAYTVQLPGQQDTPRSHLLAHDLHRAAAQGGLGRDRLGGTRVLQRRAPPADLPLAHARRPHRHGRPRRALPLQLAHRRRLRPRARSDRRRTSARCGSSSPPSARRASRTRGAGRWAGRATSSPPWATSASAASPGPAATPATAWPPRTSQAGRSPT